MQKTITQVRLGHQKVINGQSMAIKTALDPDDQDELRMRQAFMLACNRHHTQTSCP
jgi:sporulation-control protein spo0M